MAVGVVRLLQLVVIGQLSVPRPQESGRDTRWDKHRPAPSSHYSKALVVVVVVQMVEVQKMQRPNVQWLPLARDSASSPGLSSDSV
jgi:hypothetical protein